MVGESESSGVQPPTRRGWRRLTPVPAVLFGAVGLPLMLLVGWLWLEDTWTGCAGFGCLAALVMIFYGFGTGLCFWYLAGISWGWPVGIVGPAAGVLIGPLAAGAVIAVLGTADMAGGLVVLCWTVAVVGLVAYPLGLLAHWALVREPLLGLVVAGPLIAFAIVAIMSAWLLGTLVAPAMLLAGAGTLAVSAWLGMRGSRRTDADTHSG